MLHNIALRAAVKLERYSEALAYSDAIAASMSARGASDLELAQALLNTAIVHRESGRPDLARTMLLRAQEVFEAARKVESLIAARVSLAELEAREDRPEEAVLLSRDVLRLRYNGLPEGDPAAVRDAHVNLSVHLTRVGGRIDAEALIHLVAATLIDDLAGSWRYAETVFRLQGLATTRYWEDEGFPASFAELEIQLAATPGVRFRAYVATLPGGEPAAEQALEQLRPVVRNATESLFLQTGPSPTAVTPRPRPELSRFPVLTRFDADAPASVAF